MTNGLTSKKDVDKKNRENEGKSALGSIQDQYVSQLSRIPELNGIPLGPLLKSALPVDLTETETEYFVQCIKHIYRNHIVLQFDVTNTCSDQVLENVRVTFQVSYSLHFSFISLFNSTFSFLNRLLLDSVKSSPSHVHPN